MADEGTVDEPEGGDGTAEESGIAEGAEETAPEESGVVAEDNGGDAAIGDSMEEGGGEDAGVGESQVDESGEVGAFEGGGEGSAEEGEREAGDSMEADISAEEGGEDGGGGGAFVVEESIEGDNSNLQPSQQEDGEGGEGGEGEISGIEGVDGTTMEESREEGESGMQEGQDDSEVLGDSQLLESQVEESEEGGGVSRVTEEEGDSMEQSGNAGMSFEGGQQHEEAAVMIQSLARSKAARKRVERIKAGEEDAFSEAQEGGRRAANVDSRGGGDAAEAVTSGVGDESREEEEDVGQSGAGESEEEEARREREKDDRRRMEAEARHSKVQERFELSKRYAEALAQREKLAALNADMQKKLAAHYASKKGDEPGGQMDEQDGSSADLEQRYFQSLRQVADSRTELEKVQLNYDHVALDMKTRLEQKQEKVRELRESFAALKSEVAAGPAGGTGGRLIPPKLLRQFEEQEKRKEEELEKVRLRNIHLRNQLRKLEGNLRRKEELSNELHLIDFEQLKIENQTLNEKIEERNEELLKLRKKTTTTVQVLTHIKEKLQFVQAENQLLKVELAELEADLSTHRDALTKAKHDRDSLRSENLRLRGEAGLIGNNDLLRDFDRRKKEIAAMQVTLEGLKMRHRVLKEHINDLGFTTNEGGKQAVSF